jgi:phytoene dehydrogenase-like protein
VNAPRQESYDAVVIGSGFGGVSAAALLQRAGLSVLLCEQDAGLGGYAHTFELGPYRFDPAVRVTYAGEEDGLYNAVLSHLGTAGQVELINVGRMYDVQLPDGRAVKCEASMEGLIEGHARVFPHAAKGFESFFNMMLTMHVQGHAMPMNLGLHNLDETAAQFPEYFSHLRRTMDEVTREHIPDDFEARSAVNASWPYQGVVPSKLSFVAIGQVVMNGAEGTYYSKGGFSSLIGATVAGLEAHGGEVLTSNGAAKIHVDDGRVSGVTLESGHRVNARYVVSNADPYITFLQLVGEAELPKGFVRKLHRYTLSHSAFIAFVATDQDLHSLDVAHEVFVPTQWDHEEDAARIAAGKPAGVWLGIPSLVDDTLGPAGDHPIAISAIAAYDLGRPWNEVREAYTQELIEIAERVIPDLGKNIKFLETATPDTLHRFTRNAGGAMYGFEHTPTQIGTKRLPHATPIDGLLLSGSWTIPGSGSLRCFASGVHTAAMILRAEGAGPPLPGAAAAGANLPELS